MQVAAGRGTGEVQGTSRGLVEDTARSKSLYSSQTQVANEEQRSAKALPILGKGLSLGHIKNFLHSPQCMNSHSNALLSTAQGKWKHLLML